MAVRKDVDDLVRDMYVMAAVAQRQGKLRDPDAATAIAADAVDTGIDLALLAAPDDPVPGLLRQAGQMLARLADRTKALALRRSDRVKAGARPVPRPESDVAAMIRSADAEAMASAGPFDRTESEELERRRVEEANKQLPETQRRLEEQRRRQVGQAEPEQPWWRRG